jgi:hypothetical protein
LGESRLDGGFRSFWLCLVIFSFVVGEYTCSIRMNSKVDNFVIVGRTSDGRTFRPSDWADRLCGIMSAFGADHRMTYSPYVRPACSLRGDKTVLVDARIHDIEPLAYNFLRNFAKDNDLQVELLPDDYFI